MKLVPLLRVWSSVSPHLTFVQLSSTLSCAITNIVYSLLCSKENCQQIYIGQTKRQLKECFGEHKTSVLNNSKYTVAEQAWFEDALRKVMWIGYDVMRIVQRCLDNAFTVLLYIFRWSKRIFEGCINCGLRLHQVRFIKIGSLQKPFTLYSLGRAGRLYCNAVAGPTETESEDGAALLQLWLNQENKVSGVSYIIANPKSRPGWLFIYTTATT